MGGTAEKAVPLKHRRLIQRLLLGVVAVVLIATVGLFIGYRRATRNPEVLMDLVQKEADMHLDRIRQIANKNGIREWQMEAESATLLDKTKTMLLTKPEVEFFMKDGDNVHLTAEQGTVNTESNAMRVSGKVSANDRLYRLQTEQLTYDPKAREIHADTPVTITGETLTLHARRMTVDIDTNVIHFDGGVEGTLSENLQF